MLNKLPYFSNSLWLDRRFYAVFLQSYCFLKKDQYVAMSRYLPARIQARRYLREIMLELIDLKEEYCRLLINSVGTTKDGLFKRYPMGMYEFIMQEIKPTDASIQYLCVKIKTINALAYEMSLSPSVDSAQFHRKRIELYNRLTKQASLTYIPLVVGIVSSRKKTSEQRREEGIAYLKQRKQCEKS